MTAIRSTSSMQSRSANIQTLSQQKFDALIVGGGINGAVSAAALAARGARVALIDRRDFSGFTSQHSSNLVWGGIKYMETYEFPLVRDLCLSRNRLLRSFPSTVHEIRFLTTVPRGFKHHPLALWLGTWAYWLMGNCATRRPRWLSRRDVEHEEPLINVDHASGFVEYSDAYLYDNDARFVFNFIHCAAERGAVVANYVESLGSTRTEAGWTTLARDTESGLETSIASTTLINAAGAFVDEHNVLAEVPTENHHVFSKGIHLIVNRISPESRVLAFFADDQRLFFVIPMGSKTCLGTTDSRVDSPHSQVTDADRKFVLDNINQRLRLARPLTNDDIIAERCGVRPLVVSQESNASEDFLQLSRRHAIEVDAPRKHLSVFGGKLTDCINIGDEVCTEISGLGINLNKATERWFGEPDDTVRDAYFEQALAMGLDSLTNPLSIEPLSRRFWRRYGAKASGLLEQIRADAHQADIIIEGTEYTRCELDHARQEEMIVKLDDFLRRRSKVALMMSKDEIRAARGLVEACEVLFPGAAQARFDEYFMTN